MIFGPSPPPPVDQELQSAHSPRRPLPPPLLPLQLTLHAARPATRKSRSSAKTSTRTAATSRAPPPTAAAAASGPSLTCCDTSTTSRDRAHPLRDLAPAVLHGTAHQSVRRAAQAVRVLPRALPDRRRRHPEGDGARVHPQPLPTRRGRHRRHMPDASICGDAIVGFPGETEEQFEATVGS